ncbi:MAG: radical SAM protein, partial [Planctomycetes bacterium]|nr:radical SAM protein [Planctomycetota bacterium]
MLHKLSMPFKYLNYRRGRTRLNTYPDRLYVESTNACNLACVMCPNGLGLMRRARGFMDFELFKSIMDEMAAHVEATTVHIWGEALLHPKITEMIAYAKRYPLDVEVSTNATLLNADMADRLLRSGLDVIYLCLDGMKQGTYEAIRKRADFEQTRRNIEEFVKLKVARGQQRPFVNVQIIEMKATATEIAEFRRHWTTPGVDAINVKAFDSWASQVDSITGLRLWEPKVPRQRYACPNLWYHVHIYWDGRLVCCDRDFDAKYPLGNVGDGVMA